MPRNFGATTDKVCSTPVTTSATDVSVCFWYRRDSTVLGFDEPFSIASAAGSSRWEVAFHSAEANRLWAFRDCTGTNAEHFVSAANMGHAGTTTKWLFAAITMAGIATPVFYHSDPATDAGPVSRTVTTTTTGTTGITTTATIWQWGGYGNGNFGFAGDLAYCSFYDAALTAGEVAEVMWRGFTTRGLVDFVPMWGDATEPNLGGVAIPKTITGTTVVNGNPPIRPFLIQPEPYYHRFVPAVSSGRPKQSRRLLPRRPPIVRGSYT